MRIWAHCTKDKNEIHWDDWEKRFEKIVAQERGFYGLNYKKPTKLFEEYLEDELTVSLK